MIKQLSYACLLLVLGSGASVRGADVDPPALAYKKVMDAQYAAKERPRPARPEEAQRVYDAYLQSIGQPAKGQAANSGGSQDRAPRIQQ